MFAPTRTARLLVRPFAPDDTDALLARRNDPDVARYQSWQLPFTPGQATSMVADLLAMDGPTRGDWWMAVLCDPGTGQAYGDLALHLDTDGHTAEVGYTLDSAHWGKGYATEAVQWLVAHLFEDLGVTRVTATMHPDNIASAMVAERAGFLFEGHTRSSCWVGDTCSDDWIYGLTRPDWEAWRDRPTGPPKDVRLVEIDPESFEDVGRLAVHKTQDRFVATVYESYGDALFPEVVDGEPLVPWLRAIEADGELAGFTMMALTNPNEPEAYLWRFLIDRRHQRRGIGHRALDLLADECRAKGETTLLVSWEPGRGSPEPFYLAHGFVPTGVIEEGEIEGRWTFPPRP